MTHDEELLERRAMYFRVTVRKQRDRMHDEELEFVFDFSRENRQTLSLTPSEMIKLRNLLNQEIQGLGIE